MKHVFNDSYIEIDYCISKHTLKLFLTKFKLENLLKTACDHKNCCQNLCASHVCVWTGIDCIFHH